MISTKFLYKITLLVVMAYEHCNYNFKMRLSLESIILKLVKRAADSAVFYTTGRIIYRFQYHDSHPLNALPLFRVHAPDFPAPLKRPGKLP